ncbi:degenerin-like protein unc-105 [Penaeus indicus]|uniref:degenerin-like protein unc-105 n=1 Tax=Penaeus indicus TaxID=29960 RepID=UPI00300D9AA1
MIRDWMMRIIDKKCYFGRNRTCDSQGRFLPLVHRDGFVYQYVLAVGASGLFNNFYARLKVPPTREGDEEGWRLLLHNTEGSVSLRVVTEGKSVYPKWNPDIQVTMKQFNTLNTRTSPCETQAGYSDRDCELGCFERAFSEGGGCWLPFMTPGSAAPCASAEQYSFSLEFVDTLLYGGNWTRGGCKCPSACDDVTYETYSDSREVEADTTRIRIFYNDLTYQVVTEEWAYTLIPLMCDIGGVLGLLLGASVLTFIEVLQCVLACCSRGCPNARQGSVTALSLH